MIFFHVQTVIQLYSEYGTIAWWPLSIYSFTSARDAAAFSFIRAFPSWMDRCNRIALCKSYCSQPYRQCVSVCVQWSNITIPYLHFDFTLHAKWLESGSQGQTIHRFSSNSRMVHAIPLAFIPLRACLHRNDHSECSFLRMAFRLDIIVTVMC